jgi:hypothetical protein
MYIYLLEVCCSATRFTKISTGLPTKSSTYLPTYLRSYRPTCLALSLSLSLSRAFGFFFKFQISWDRWYAPLACGNGRADGNFGVLNSSGNRRPCTGPAIHKAQSTLTKAEALSSLQTVLMEIADDDSRF